VLYFDACSMENDAEQPPGGGGKARKSEVYSCQDPRRDGKKMVSGVGLFEEV